jgi:hypothetical protein
MSANGILVADASGTPAPRAVLSDGLDVELTA